MRVLDLPPKLALRFKEIKGFQTIDRIMKKLRVSRTNAVRIIHELRKRKLAETIGGGPKKRLFKISALPVIKEENELYAYLSKNSRLALNISPAKILSKKITRESAIIEAFLDNNFRVWIAGLSLFRKDIDWDYLSFLAIEKGITRVVGAFYDAAKRVIRVRKMPLRIRKRLIKYDFCSKFALRKIKNKEFQDIEKIWRVSIPFSKEDIKRLKQ